MKRCNRKRLARGDSEPRDRAWRVNGRFRNINVQGREASLDLNYRRFLACIKRMGRRFKRTRSAQRIRLRNRRRGVQAAGATP